MKIKTSLRIAAGILIAASALSESRAVDRTWVIAPPGEGDFLLGTNWSPSFETAWGAADRAIITNGGTPVLAGGFTTITELWVGNLSGTSGNMRMTNGDLVPSAAITVGRQGATGVLAVDDSGGATNITTNFLRIGTTAVGSTTAGNATFTLSGSQTTLLSGTAGGFAGIGLSSYTASGLSTTGVATISDGAIWTHAGTGVFLVGADNNTAGQNGGTGTLNVRGGASVSTGGEIWVGNSVGSNGTLNIEGGTVTSGSWLAIGRNNGAGTLNISGGTLVHTASGSVNGSGGFNGNNITTAGIGVNARGTVIQTGGVIQNLNSLVIVGENGTVTWDASGGSAELGGVYIGFAANSNGTMTLTGDASYNATEVVLSSNGSTAGGTGRLNLSGGTLTAGSVREGAGNGGSVHFGGGTLKAAVSNADYFQGFEAGKLVIDAAGMIFDSNGNEVTVTQALTGTGGVTKRGEGLLELAGNSTYLGNTIVENGTLRAGAAFFGDFSSIYLLGNGVIDLNFIGTDSVAQLFFDGTLQAAGTWGAIGSGAEHVSERFSGSGTITVTAVPEPSTYLLVSAGAGFVALMRRRKRSA